MKVACLRQAQIIVLLVGELLHKMSPLKCKCGIKNMYAVITTGGKQYRVANGQRLKIEKLSAAVGETVTFSQILMVANGSELNVGRPYLANAKVEAEVVSHGRHAKIEIIKLKRRKHHLKHQGHRQHYTEVKITSIA